jgi:transposase
LIIFIDESNVNLFLRRRKGRAEIGRRAVARLPTSKGQNIHMIGAICQTGWIHFMRKRGAFHSADFINWLKAVILNALAQGASASNIVIVMDNAPCHSKSETVVDEFAGISILRLAPYSPMFNPIEMAWSVMKTYLKQKEAAYLQDVIGVDNYNGLTQTEYRLRFIERLIDESRDLITPIKCLQFVNHTQTFFSAALALKDISVGE